MSLIQTIFGITISLMIFSVVIYLIRNGKLKEEYSWLWFLTGLVLLILVVRYDLLLFLTKLTGAVLPTTTLFIFGIIFLMLICLHFAVKVSLLTNQVKNLAQKISILEAQIENNENIKEAFK